MKFGTQTRAAAFLAYEYKNIRNLGKIIALNDSDELRYFIFEDERDKDKIVTVVYNDTNLKVFYSSDNTVENLSEPWREFNKKHNPEIYEKHMQKLLNLQKRKDDMVVVEIENL